MAPCLLLYYILYVTQNEIIVEEGKSKVGRRTGESRQTKTHNMVRTRCSPIRPRVSVAARVGHVLSHVPPQLIVLLRGKRDNRKEEEGEEEESREDKETKEYVPVGPVCHLVLRVAVNARAGLIPPLQ